MRSLDSRRCVNAFKKVVLTATFDGATSVRQCPLLSSFSSFHALRIDHNPLWLRRRYLGQGQFNAYRHEFHEFPCGHA
jgi:hypothetical protein